MQKSRKEHCNEQEDMKPKTPPQFITRRCTKCGLHYAWKELKFNCDVDTILIRKRCPHCRHLNIFDKKWNIEDTAAWMITAVAIVIMIKMLL